MVPSQSELTDAITDATRKAVSELFRQHPERFYYCSLITTGEAHRPHISAWSKEALDAVARKDPDPVGARQLLKWSYADSPYCCFGDEYFEVVKELFGRRPRMDPDDPDGW